MRFLPESLMAKYGHLQHRDSDYPSTVFGVLCLGIIVSKIIIFIMTCVIMASTHLSITTDERATWWVNSVSPIDIVFDYTTINAVIEQIHENNLSIGIGGSYLFCIFVKLCFSITLWYNFIYDCLRHLREYGVIFYDVYDKRTNSYKLTEIENDIFVTLIWWIIIWYIICSIGLAEYIGDQFHVYRNKTVCLNWEETGNACDNICEIDSSLYGWSIFLSFTIVMMIIPTEEIINGVYDRCPNAPYFPTVWGFVWLFIFLIIYIWLICMCYSCVCEEKDKIIAITSETSDSVTGDRRDRRYDRNNEDHEMKITI